MFGWFVAGHDGIYFSIFCAAKHQTVRSDSGARLGCVRQDCRPTCDTWIGLDLSLFSTTTFVAFHWPYFLSATSATLAQCDRTGRV